MFGRDVDERPRGEEFLEWLADPLRQEQGGSVGAFARWAVAAVEDGELRPTHLWYPGAMKARSRQFPEDDWKCAKQMYTTRDMVYCSGDGLDEDERDGEGEWVTSGSSCWVAGSCLGWCSSQSKRGDG